MARRRIGKITIKQTRRITVTRRVSTRIVPVAQPRPTVTRSPPTRGLSRPSRRVTYSHSERQLLNDVRAAVDTDAERDRDAFLCHAWDDRTGAASELFDELCSLNVDAWFSEKDVVLGKSLPRQLDAGLRVSRVGIVLVTPNMLRSLRVGGFADQELGALLATEPGHPGEPRCQLRGTPSREPSARRARRSVDRRIIAGRGRRQDR